MNKTLLRNDRKINHFSDPHFCRNFRIVTVLMFVFLIGEKIFSGETAFVYKGHIEFYFKLDMIDLLSVMVYLTTVLLLRFKVKYHYLLLPDLVLLGIKIFYVVTGIINLLSPSDYIMILTNMEKVIEGILFSLFLLCLFYGKLFGNKNFNRICPRICFFLLLFCFVSTITIEIYKLIIAPINDVNSFLYYFNFFKAIANELFLDLPYFLLTLLIFRISDKK